MQKNLFEDFSKVSDQEWKEKIIVDLKGKSIKDLSWNVKEDLTIKSYYTEADAKGIDFPTNFVKSVNAADIFNLSTGEPDV